MSIISIYYHCFKIFLLFRESDEYVPLPVNTEKKIYLSPYALRAVVMVMAKQKRPVLTDEAATVLIETYVNARERCTEYRELFVSVDLFHDM